MFSSSVHDKIQRLGAEEEPPMTLANEGTSGRPSTNEDVANKPRRITRAQHSTHGDVRSKSRRTTKSA